MKIVLFCENAYAFGVMAPIRDELVIRGCQYIWYVSEKLQPIFPFPEEKHTSSIADLKQFKPSALFVPGNEVPYYLPGLKVQIFHGLAGEKKGHFRIRHYFDLYLTQGPFFTERFLDLKRKFKDFDVIETGWSKLDLYHQQGTVEKAAIEKGKLLDKHNSKHLILYAPTFSPSLSSAKYLSSEIKALAQNRDYLILIKFHDLMEFELIESYKKLAQEHSNIIYIEDANILPYLLMSDLMISDTSSVVYEFLLLNKPVISYKARSPKASWLNITEATELTQAVKKEISQDSKSLKRAEIIASYHPYHDGKSSSRMLEAVKDYISKNGIPQERKLSFFRKWKINKMYRK